MKTDPQTPHREIIFERHNPWLGRVIKKDGNYFLLFPAGADANHDSRLFKAPIAEEEIKVLSSNLSRHILVMSALSALGGTAGTERPIDEVAVRKILTTILTESEPIIESFLKEIPMDIGMLVAHGAHPILLEQGNIFPAIESVTETSDWNITWEYYADRDRRRRGVVLSPLDKALLLFCGQYVHRSTIPSRNPEAVDKVLLPKVLEVISVAEEAGNGIELPSWKSREYSAQQKTEWNYLEDKVTTAIKTTYPELSGDTLGPISSLICNEAVDRVRAA